MGVTSPSLPDIDSLLGVARSGRLALDALIGYAEEIKRTMGARQAADLYAVWCAHTESPARCVALFNWGVLLSELGDLDAAEAAYRESFALNPQIHQAKINAGLVLERKGNLDGAVALWRDAAEAARSRVDGVPFATIALNHIGRLLETRKDYAAAEAALSDSLTLNPHQPDAIQHWVHLRQRQCHWPVYAPLPGVRVNALLASTSPLATLAASDDPALQWLSSQSFVRRKYPFSDAKPLPATSVGPAQLIRLGYLSGDLCTHAVGLLMTELIEAHDRAAFRVSAFDFSPEDGTAHRARLRQAFDDVVPIHTMTDHAAAQAIRAHDIDVLIDLHGLSSGARPGILAERPAPHIGTYLGFIGTTALPWVDFVVTDRFTLPETLAPYFTEEPLYVDGSMIPLHDDPVPTGRLTRASVGLPEDAVVLACFNNAYKFTPEICAAWMRVIRDCDGSVLWLLDDNPGASAQLACVARDAGVDASRVVFAKRCSHAEYRERLTLADLYLDTYPYNAGSTARDVLDARLPIVTLSGRTPVSRMAGGMLHAAGLDELIATDIDGYEQLLRNLASTPARLRALRQTLIERAATWRDAPTRIVRSLEQQLTARLRG